MQRGRGRWPVGLGAVAVGAARRDPSRLTGWCGSAGEWEEQRLPRSLEAFHAAVARGGQRSLKNCGRRGWFQVIF